MRFSSRIGPVQACYAYTAISRMVWGHRLLQTTKAFFLPFR